MFRCLCLFFYFADHLFDQDCSNGKVYELLIKDIINAAIEGFNGTFKILALD